MPLAACCTCFFLMCRLSWSTIDDVGFVCADGLIGSYHKSIGVSLSLTKISLFLK